MPVQAFPSSDPDAHVIIRRDKHGVVVRALDRDDVDGSRVVVEPWPSSICVTTYFSTALSPEARPCAASLLRS